VSTATKKKAAPTKVKTAPSGTQTLPFSFDPITLGNSSSVPTVEWAQSLLTIMQLPDTPNNVTNVLIWVHNEQDASSWKTDATNPLGVETNGKVESQKNVLAGLSLTAATIQKYPSIVQALKADAPTQIFANAVVNSKWNTGKAGTGLYGGKTVTQFIKLGPLVTTGSQSLGFLQQVEGGSGPQVVKTAASAASSLGSLEANLTSGTFWKRIGVGALGVGLAITGIVIFIATSKTGEKTISTGEKAGMLAA